MREGALFGVLRTPNRAPSRIIQAQNHIVRVPAIVRVKSLGTYPHYRGHPTVSYNRNHGRCVPKSFILCCCSGRDSCMLTSRCMLPWLRSAPYPALCPCEPLGPVGDMQAVSYGARSRQYSPLLPASLLFWSRLVHTDLAMHDTLAALGTLPRSMSL